MLERMGPRPVSAMVAVVFDVLFCMLCFVVLLLSFIFVLVFAFIFGESFCAFKFH
jgi:hypothetical protein